MPVSPKMENFAKKVVILWVIPEVIPEFFCLVEGVSYKYYSRALPDSTGS